MAYGKGKAILLQAQRVPGGWGSQISRQLAHEDGKVVTPYALAAFTLQEILLVLISLEAESTPGPCHGLWSDSYLRTQLPAGVHTHTTRTWKNATILSVLQSFCNGMI